MNRNTVPFDERPPTVASGVRLGTPAVTMRGFDEDDMREVGRDHLRGARGRSRPGGAARAQRGPLRQPTALPGLPGLHDVPMNDIAAGAPSATTSRRLVVVDHPLVRHKLGLLRDETTTTQMFRQLVNELTLLLTYEATKELVTEVVRVKTPNEWAEVERISGKKVAVCPILRAGVGMLDGVLSLISGARVGFIGLYRDEETLQPVEYYVKLPQDIAERDVILLDPMLATGNSTAAAVELVEARRGASRRRHRAHRGAGGHRARARRPPRGHDRRRSRRPRPERARLHRSGPRRRRRSALRNADEGRMRSGLRKTGSPGIM